MKKNKKGFTLIELLAVIVILGIIITIVVTNVVKYVKQARQGSYRDAVGVFVKNVQNSLMAEAVEGGDGTVTTCDDKSDEAAKKCESKYDYDISNMQITIAELGKEKTNHVITIIGKNSFKGLSIKGDYCPAHANCNTPGQVILYMSPSGELKDSE